MSRSFYSIVVLWYTVNVLLWYCGTLAILYYITVLHYLCPLIVFGTVSISYFSAVFERKYPTIDLWYCAIVLL